MVRICDIQNSLIAKKWAEMLTDDCIIAENLTAFEYIYIVHIFELRRIICRSSQLLINTF